ncbi:MAG: transcriptional repressor [Sedimenticola sp.]|nr:MAG: transcriptional repressor [Sedimenticola sp.]
MKQHDTDYQTALSLAEGICRQMDVRLTSQRRQVLQILCQQARPMGAYEVLDVLRQQLPSAKPVTVYRALDFLLQQGLVHRLESLNAFIGCTHPQSPHDSQFLICRDCGEVEELEDRGIDQTLGQAVAACGFQAEDRVVEVTGRCARCCNRTQP